MTKKQFYKSLLNNADILPVNLRNPSSILSKITTKKTDTRAERTFYSLNNFYKRYVSNNSYEKQEIDSQIEEKPVDQNFLFFNQNILLNKDLGISLKPYTVSFLSLSFASKSTSQGNLELQEKSILESREDIDETQNILKYSNVLERLNTIEWDIVNNKFKTNVEDNLPEEKLYAIYYHTFINDIDKIRSITVDEINFNNSLRKKDLSGLDLNKDTLVFYYKDPNSENTTTDKDFFTELNLFSDTSDNKNKLIEFYDKDNKRSNKRRIIEEEKKYYLECNRKEEIIFNENKDERESFFLFGTNDIDLEFIETEAEIPGIVFSYDIINEKVIITSNGINETVEF